MLETKAESDLLEPSDGAPAPSGKDTPRRVLVVLHQLNSTPGHVGAWLRRRGFTLDIRRPRFGDPLPETLARHAGAVIFGGPMSANDPDDYIRQETDWIAVPLAEGKPFLGICLGAQMLANHLGGRVYAHPAQHVEIGYHPVTPTAEAARLCAWPQRFYQWHREGFEAPRAAKLLATAGNAFAEQAFAHGAAVGVQFHPEITYAQVSCWSGRFGHRLTLPGAHARHHHLSGHLTHAPHVQLWMDGFLARWLEGSVSGES
jgi:GMP synthase (glutamine-hydrolysing)